MIHYDPRWSGPHGIGRFSDEVVPRLNGARPLDPGVRRLSLRDLNLGRGLAVFAIIALPWHVLVAWREPGLLWFYLVDNQILRFLDLRAFLLDTCVLGRLNGPICDRFLNRDDSERLLQELERRQVFTGAIYDIIADIFAYERQPMKRDDASVLYQVAQYVCSLVLRSLKAAPDTNATLVPAAAVSSASRARSASSRLSDGWRLCPSRTGARSR